MAFVLYGRDPERAQIGALLDAARASVSGALALIFAAREGDVRAFEADDVPSPTLSGLDADAAGVLLSRGTVRVGPAVRERLVARTRGKALALVELPSVLTEAQLAGEEPLPEALHQAVACPDAGAPDAGPTRSRSALALSSLVRVTG